MSLTYLRFLARTRAPWGKTPSFLTNLVEFLILRLITSTSELTPRAVQRCRRVREDPNGE
jgi:hypothetical protein